MEICTLYKGVPYGLAIISYTNKKCPQASFKGVGVFRDGKLHNSPFTCVRGNGVGISFSRMIDGKPSDSNYHTYFLEKGFKANLDSTVLKADVSGW